MAARKLKEFRFEPGSDGENVKLHVVDDSGQVLELLATREQLDLLAESIDEFLDATEEADRADEA
jgi:hypothetical protein